MTVGIRFIGLKVEMVEVVEMVKIVGYF